MSVRDNASRKTFENEEQLFLVGTRAVNRHTDVLKGGEQVDDCCTSQRGGTRS